MGFVIWRRSVGFLSARVDEMARLYNLTAKYGVHPAIRANGHGVLFLVCMGLDDDEAKAVPGLHHAGMPTRWEEYIWEERSQQESNLVEAGRPLNKQTATQVMRARVFSGAAHRLDTGRSNASRICPEDD